MTQIVGNRSSGKTYKLMLEAKEKHGTIICSNPNAMSEKAKAYGLTGINFMSYYDFLQSPAEDLGAYYIDELELFAQYMTIRNNMRGNFTGYTLSLE